MSTINNNTETRKASTTGYLLNPEYYKDATKKAYLTHPETFKGI